MCRATFLRSQIIPAEATLRGDELYVWSVEGMLTDLRVQSCRVVKGVNIFKKWTCNHKKWFWSALNCVAQRPHRRILFLYLTKATAAHVIAASAQEIEQAMRNFEINEFCQDRDVNATKVIIFILTKLH
jgi:nitric oxide reductase activation protein